MNTTLSFNILPFPSTSLPLEHPVVLLRCVFGHCILSGELDWPDGSKQREETWQRKRIHTATHINTLVLKHTSQCLGFTFTHWCCRQALTESPSMFELSLQNTMTQNTAEMFSFSQQMIFWFSATDIILGSLYMSLSRKLYLCTCAWASWWHQENNFTFIMKSKCTRWSTSPLLSNVLWRLSSIILVVNHSGQWFDVLKCRRHKGVNSEKTTLFYSNLSYTALQHHLTAHCPQWRTHSEVQWNTVRHVISNTINLQSICHSLSGNISTVIYCGEARLPWCTLPHHSCLWFLSYKAKPTTDRTSQPVVYTNIAHNHYISLSMLYLSAVIFNVNSRSTLTTSYPNTLAKWLEHLISFLNHTVKLVFHSQF